MNRISFFCLLILFFSNSGQAEVVKTQPGYFEVQIEHQIKTSSTDLQNKLLDIAQWWSAGHTYSGDSDNLFVDIDTLRCFCEKLDDGGFVSHLKLINYQPRQLMRFSGGLGPLQSLLVNGVMDISLRPLAEDKTMLLLNYRVSSNVENIKKWAGPVDQVLREQLRRLKSLTER